MELGEPTAMSATREDGVRALAQAALVLAKKLFGRLAGRRLALLGAGATARCFAECFAAEGSIPVTGAGAQSSPVAVADVLVLADAPGAISAAALRDECRKRRHRPLLLIDLRANAQRELSALPSTFAFDRADLRRLIATGACGEPGAVTT